MKTHLVAPVQLTGGAIFVFRLADRYFKDISHLRRGISVAGITYEVEMDFLVYQSKAAETAVYPDTAKFIYPSLGLAGGDGQACQPGQEDRSG
jgi:hypothetical protein